MIKAIIFDCFGVIVSDGLSALLDDYESRGGQNRSQVSELINQVNRGEINPQQSRHEVTKLLNMTAAEYVEQVKQKEVYNRELLQQITVLRRHFTTALLTNITRPSLERRFKESELSLYFNHQFVSGELKIAKPDPAVYQHVLKTLGLQPAECVFVDDRAAYLLPAQEIGIHTILFIDNQQLKQDLQQIFRRTGTIFEL